MKIGELITDSEPLSQFRLIDVFGLVTFVAVFFATLTPLLRLIDLENLTLMVTPAALLHVTIHFAAVTLAIVYAVYRRKRLEKQAGRRFGVAFCLPTKSASSPRMKSMLTLMGLICFQVGSIATHFYRQDISILTLHTAQLALIYGGVVVNLLLKAYPGTVEFFESGIAVRQTFHPWTDIQLHKSTQSDDRIRLLIDRKLAGLPQVSKELESAIRDHHAKAPSNQVHPLDRAG